MAEHTNEGSTHPLSDHKRSQLYTKITIGIAIVFALVALIIVVPSGNSAERVIRPVEVSGTVSVFVPQEVGLGCYKYYTLNQGATLVTNFTIGEFYPIGWMGNEQRLITTDDRGSKMFRAGTPFLSIKNPSKSAVTIAIGRCSNDGRKCGIEFTDASKDMSNHRNVSSGDVLASIKAWIIWMAVIFIVWYGVKSILVWLFPESLIRPFWGGKKEKTNAHASHEGDLSKHEGGNGLNYGFVSVLTSTLIYGSATLYALWTYTGVELLYALIPMTGFVSFLLYIHERGYSVPTHKIMGIYSKYTNDEAYTWQQGDGFAVDDYVVGTPAGQGAVDVNLDNYNVDLSPDGFDTEIVTSDNKFVQLQYQRGFFHVDPNEKTEWLTRFRDGSLEGLTKYIIETYWQAVAIVSSEMTLPQIREVKNRSIKDGEEKGFVFCEKVDTVLFKIFERDGVKLKGHTSMGPVKVKDDLKKSMALKGILAEAKAGVKDEYTSLSDAEAEKVARIWMGISNEHYDIKGLDKTTLPAVVEIAKALLKK